MIVTVTPNPSVDRTVFVDDVVLGSVNRGRRSRSEPSGKGVNVSRTLHANGIEAVAVVPLGGPTGHHLAELLALEGVRHRTVPQSTATRVNTTLAASGGHTAKVNGPGGQLTDDDLTGLTTEVASALTDADDDQVWLAVCGSLPKTHVHLGRQTFSAFFRADRGPTRGASGPSRTCRLRKSERSFIYKPRACESATPTKSTLSASRRST